MRRQSGDNDCGPTAIANALEVHHRRIGLRPLRELTGCEPNGSDEDDILRALLALGCPADVHEGDDQRQAKVWLLSSLAHGRPVLLCVDRWDHWITVIGTCADQAVIYDPARETGGTYVLRWKALRARWEAARQVRGRAARYYGVAVGD